MTKADSPIRITSSTPRITAYRLLATTLRVVRLAALFAWRPGSKEIERRLGVADRLAGCLTDPRAPEWVLLRLGRALIEQYCASFRQMPKRIILDVECGHEAALAVKHGPGSRSLRTDSHYAAPEVLDWCRANQIDWVLGLAPNAALRRHVEALEKSTAERFTAAPARGKVRRFAQFYDAAGSRSRVERIIARVEAGPEGTDTRFIVMNLEGGRPKKLYQGLHCARGQAENHIKAWKNHLAADRTSCHEAEANQFRLFLHAGAYWLLWSLRRVMPKRSAWRVMQFDTLRLRLLKLAARVVELKTQIKIHLPSSAPDQAIFAMLLDRLPRLVI